LELETLADRFEGEDEQQGCTREAQLGQAVADGLLGAIEAEQPVDSEWGG
jgi:hypothetical protein